MFIIPLLSSVVWTYCYCQSEDASNSLVPPPVDAFIAQFAQEVKSSAVLTDMFNLGEIITPDELAAGIFYVSTMFWSMNEDKNAAEYANETTKYIASSVDEINLNEFVRVFSGSLGKQLYSDGTLNQENAKSLAQKCTEVVESAANLIDKRFPRSRVTAVAVAFEDVLQNTGLFNNNTVGNIREIYAREWLYLALNQTDEAPQRPTHCINPETLEKATGDSALSPKEDVCFMKSPTVAIFRSTFTSLVLSSQVISEAFDLSDQTPAEYHRAAFYVVQFVMSKIGEKSNAAYGDFMAKYIGQMDGLSLPRMMRVVGNIVGKYAEMKGAINEKTAANFAKEYVKVLEESVNLIYNKKYPRSKVPAISAGTGKHLLMQGLLGLKDTKQFAQYFGTEWYCETLRQNARNCQRA